MGHAWHSALHTSALDNPSSAQVGLGILKPETKEEGTQAGGGCLWSQPEELSVAEYKFSRQAIKGGFANLRRYALDEKGTGNFLLQPEDVITGTTTEEEQVLKDANVLELEATLADIAAVGAITFIKRNYADNATMQEACKGTVAPLIAQVERAKAESRGRQLAATAGRVHDAKECQDRLYVYAYA